MRIVHWALYKLRRYTTFAAQVQIVLPTEAEGACMLTRNCNLKLQTWMVDLSAYRLEWIVAKNPWDPVDSFLGCPEEVVCEPDTTPWEGEVPLFDHEDSELIMPRAGTPASADLGALEQSILVQFDGGAAG